MDQTRWIVLLPARVAGKLFDCLPKMLVITSKSYFWLVSEIYRKIISGTSHSFIVVFCALICYAVQFIKYTSLIHTVCVSVPEFWIRQKGKLILTVSWPSHLASEFTLLQLPRVINPSTSCLILLPAGYRRTLNLWDSVGTARVSTLSSKKLPSPGVSLVLRAGQCAFCAGAGGGS